MELLSPGPEWRIGGPEEEDHCTGCSDRELERGGVSRQQNDGGSTDTLPRGSGAKAAGHTCTIGASVAPRIDDLRPLEAVSAVTVHLTSAICGARVE